MNKNIAKARIAYDGPALEQGTIDVRELAPSLLAFADLVDNVNKVLGGEQKIQVLLNQDSIQKGSFDITTILQYSLIQQVQLFVSAADQNGLSSIMTVLGWGAIGEGIVAGIFTFIKKIQGRKIKAVEEQGNKVTVTLSDGKTIVTSQNTFNVYLNINCRQSIDRVLAPLQTEGIDTFELRDPKQSSNKQAIESIDKTDVPYFKAPPVNSAENVETFPEQEMTVKITSVTFEKGNKWKLTDGNNTFWATIKDEKFLDDVDKGNIAFKNGDMLRIRYHIQQIQKGKTLSTEYTVTKILEVKERPEQIKLDI